MSRWARCLSRGRPSNAGRDSPTPGCPHDADNDSVFDGVDQCPLTIVGATVDEKGCPKDSDGDKVLDGLDQCPDTIKGSKIDKEGCPRIRLDKPPFDKRDMICHTPFGIGPNRKFDEAESVSLIVKGDQDFYRFAQFASKIAVNLSGLSSWC